MNTPKILKGKDLGVAPFTSPTATRRGRNPRRETLTAEAIRAIRLNNELAGEDGLRYAAPEDSNLSRTLFSGTPKPPRPPPPGVHTSLHGRKIVIDGRSMDLSDLPADMDTFSKMRRWDKLLRANLSGEERELFHTSATTQALAKHNKLCTLSTKEDEDGILKQVNNTRSQLRLLQEHMTLNDIADVFTIVSVDDVLVTGSIHEGPQGGPLVYDLFQDYPRLHAAQVAASNAWYNTWLAANQPYVKENLQLTFELLKNSTEVKLWTKCLDEYEDFHPIQQGGPLMFYIIMKNIQNSSEAAVEHLRNKIKALNIRKVPEENVETIVSLIKSAHYALLNASTPGRSFVPDDFPKQLLEIMQTSTNKEFNDVFQDEKSKAQRDADKHGGQPAWPSVAEILRLALNTYRRLVQSGDWDGTAVGSKRRALTAPTTAPRDSTGGYGHRQGRGSGPPPFRRPRICFNCEKEGHLVPTCPDPIDPERIKKNKKAFLDSKRDSDTSRSQLPKYKTAKDGKRLVLNERGLYVQDVAANAKAQAKAQKKAQAQETKLNKLADHLTDRVTGLLARMSSSSTTTAPSNSPVSSQSLIATDLNSHRDSIRQALLADLRES